MGEDLHTDVASATCRQHAKQHRKGNSCPGLNNTKSYSPGAVADRWGTDGVYESLGVLEQGNITQRTLGTCLQGRGAAEARTLKADPDDPEVS